MVLAAKGVVSLSYHYPRISVLSCIITHLSEKVGYVTTGFIMDKSVPSSIIVLNGDSSQNNVFHAGLKMAVNSSRV